VHLKHADLVGAAVPILNGAHLAGGGHGWEWMGAQ
jgi:hypothetical protein